MFSSGDRPLRDLNPVSRFRPRATETLLRFAMLKRIALADLRDEMRRVSGTSGAV